MNNRTLHRRRPLRSPEESEGPQETTPPEPEPAPEPMPAPEPPSETESSPTSSDARENSRLVAQLMESQRLSVQNFQLVVSRVGQMADSLESALKMMREALDVMKTVADLQQEFLAALNEQTERLITVSAALLRYSQEQAALQASGGSQASQASQ